MFKASRWLARLLIMLLLGCAASEEADQSFSVVQPTQALIPTATPYPRAWARSIDAANVVYLVPTWIEQMEAE
ncbi:MAG: hypothetical protein AAF633_16180, partial [Chloroflexota bacterium]